jgi:hypothetical protein
MKSPHNHHPYDRARADTEKFIATYSGRPGTRAKTSATAKKAAPLRGRATTARPARAPAAK